MPTAWTGFVSLNGPDNVGKTTQLRILAQHRSGFQPLGAIHDHDSEPWERVAADGYAAWWFETSTTVELTGMLLAGHAKRAAAREAGRTGLLDRGLPMLLAVAAATCAVKDGLPVQQAMDTVAGIAAAYPHWPETAVLLVPALDAERSYAITSAREGRPWTGVYPTYQKTLHAVLLQQADHGAYAAVVNCEDRSPDDVHAEIAALLDSSLPAPPLMDGNP
ncbi:MULTISPECIES: hypothetical protein [Streptomyces]|uniref:hypothetical protein n=1 Tax=Streptomyces TaxID=1883 RepID=UPI0004BF412F|nr:MULTISPECIES: hypothetical protein [Streptomyces]MDX3280460.1 hypothetical protein [Streptomyces scabiei]MDX3846941.1 hypothetical protein [Streptomyces europaeiscabiei]